MKYRGCGLSPERLELRRRKCRTLCRQVNFDRLTGTMLAERPPTRPRQTKSQLARNGRDASCSNSYGPYREPKHWETNTELAIILPRMLSYGTSFSRWTVICTVRHSPE